MQMMLRRTWLAGGMLALMLTGCQSTRSWWRRMNAEPVRTVQVNGIPMTIQHLEHTVYNDTYKFVGKMPRVKFVTIHNTWNVAPAWRERAYLNNRQDKVYLSFQYAVDEAGALQLMGDRERAWHAGDGHGDGNYSSLAIEICRSRCVGKDEHLYRKAEENAVKLAAWLLYVNDLSIRKLRKHQDWSGKNCPHRILDEKRWPAFKDAVAKSLKQLQDSQAPKSY